MGSGRESLDTTGPADYEMRAPSGSHRQSAGRLTTELRGSVQCRETATDRSRHGSGCSAIIPNETGCPGRRGTDRARLRPTVRGPCPGGRRYRGAPDTVEMRFQRVHPVPLRPPDPRVGRLGPFRGRMEFPTSTHAGRGYPRTRATLGPGSRRCREGELAEGATRSTAFQPREGPTQPRPSGLTPSDAKGAHRQRKKG